MVTRILFDPRRDLPGGTTVSSPVTVEATPTGVREDGSVVIYPTTVTFTVNTAADLVQLPANTASNAWRITVRNPATSAVLQTRTVRVPDTASVNYQAVPDVDPASLQVNPGTARQWDATFWAIMQTVASLPTSAAITAQINAAVTALVGGASTALDTLGEIQAALGNDPNLAATITAAIAGKASPADVTAAVNALATSLSATYSPLLGVLATVTTAVAPMVGKIQPYNASGGALAPTLPALSGLTVGAIYSVQKAVADTSANLITITAAGSDTFDSGATTIALRGAGELRDLQVVQIGSTKYWKVVGGNTPLSYFDGAYASVRAANAQRADLMRRGFAPPLPQDTPTVVFEQIGVFPTGRVAPLRVGGTNAGTVDFANDTHFRYDQTPSLDPVPADNQWVQAPLLPGGAAQSAGYCYTVETVTGADATIQLVFRTSSTTAQFRIAVNGRPLRQGIYRFTGLTAGGAHRLLLTFPVAAVRTVKVTVEGSGFAGGATPSGTLARPTAPLGTRYAILGDSYEGGSGSFPDGATRMETGGYQAALILGAEAVWNFGIGGTGYVASPSSNAFSTRVAAIIAAAPDVVIVSGSINDGTADTPAIRSAVTDVLNGLASISKVYVTGPSRSVSYAGASAAIAASAAAANRPYLDALAEPWLTAAMIAPDNQHPNWAGHLRRASRISEQILALTAP